MQCNPERRDCRVGTAMHACHRVGVLFWACIPRGRGAEKGGTAL